MQKFIEFSKSFNFRTFFEKPHKNEYRHRRRCFTQFSHFCSTLSISFIRLYSLLTDTHERCLMYCIIWSFIALMYYWRILRIFSSALYPIVNLSPLYFFMSKRNFQSYVFIRYCCSFQTSLHKHHQVQKNAKLYFCFIVIRRFYILFSLCDVLKVKYLELYKQLKIIR